MPVPMSEEEARQLLGTIKHRWELEGIDFSDDRDVEIEFDYLTGKISLEQRNTRITDIILEKIPGLPREQIFAVIADTALT